MKFISAYCIHLFYNHVVIVTEKLQLDMLPGDLTAVSLSPAAASATSDSGLGDSASGFGHVSNSVRMGYYGPASMSHAFKDLSTISGIANARSLDIKFKL